MSRRLVSVRKVTVVLPIVGHPDKRMVTADGFQVPISSKLKITPGELVLLIKSGTFLPSHVPEWADLEPQTDWDGVSGFVVHKPAPFIVRGKPQHIFDGILVPVSDFPQIAGHIAHNMTKYTNDAALLEALRKTETFTKYLEVVEYKPQPSPGGSALTSPTSSDGAFDLKPFPAADGGHRSVNGQYQILGKRPYFCPKFDMINAEDISTLFASRNGNIDNKYAVTTFMVGSPSKSIPYSPPVPPHLTKVPTVAIYFLSKTSRHIGAVSRALDLPHGKMGVCSRTLDLKVDSSQYPLHWALVKNLDLPRKLDAMNKSLVVHGVLCGPTIRDNYEETPKPEFFAYAVQRVDARNDGNVSTGKMVAAGQETWDLLDKLGVQKVPVHDDAVAMSELADGQEGLAALASGEGWYTQRRAGLVFRNVKTGRAFKVMSKEYVARYGKRTIRNETQSKSAHLFE